ncbi:Fur family transcriptional regulator [Actinokineospora sp. G85]|uniref:Fur family transcriptional regulator n=1 Tax=Actinokineospora sp. G85 TaxID=3406626 RepID=UPI003C7396D8
METAHPIARRRAELRETLHGRGMRMTPQRQLVLDALLELEHATPEQVCHHVQRTTPTVNITTVYRTLELLEELSVIRHTHLGHGAPTYSVDGHEHVHLVCHRCGRVDETDIEVMSELCGTLRAAHGFALDATHLALSGTCEPCTRAKAAENNQRAQEGQA